MHAFDIENLKNEINNFTTANNLLLDQAKLILQWRATRPVTGMDLAEYKSHLAKSVEASKAKLIENFSFLYNELDQNFWMSEISKLFKTEINSNNIHLNQGSLGVSGS